MTLRKMIKTEAKASLRGRWGRAILCLAVVAAVELCIHLVDAAAMALLGYDFQWRWGAMGFSYGRQFFTIPALGVTAAAAIIWLLLAAPLWTGRRNWLLELTDRRAHPVSHIFWPYEGRTWLRSAGLEIFIKVSTGVAAVILAVIPGALLLLGTGNLPLEGMGTLPPLLANILTIAGGILGIVAALLLWTWWQRFTIARILLCEKYNLSLGQALGLSKRYMKGHRWEMVRFDLSFLPWTFPSLAVLLLTGILQRSIGQYWFYPHFLYGPGLVLFMVVTLLVLLYLAPYYGMARVMYARYLYECGRWEEGNSAPAPEQPARQEENPQEKEEPEKGSKTVDQLLQEERSCPVIRNIVFDVGDVLLRFDPAGELEKMFPTQTEEQRQELLEGIFWNPAWKELDLGTTTEEDYFRRARESYPHRREDIDLLEQKWYDCLSPIASTVALMGRLKENGYRLLVLSNFPEKAFQEMTQRYLFMRDFDGGVVSYQLHLTKPDPEIYQALIYREGIVPGETVYVDDKLENVEAAQAAGLRAFQLKDCQSGPFEAWLQQLGVRATLEQNT